MCRHILYACVCVCERKKRCTLNLSNILYKLLQIAHIGVKKGSVASYVVAKKQETNLHVCQ